MEEIIALVFFGVVELLFVNTGRIVVRGASLGRWRGEQIGGSESRIYAPAGSLSFVLDGQRIVTRTGLALIGVAFIVVSLTILVAALGTR